MNRLALVVLLFASQWSFSQIPDFGTIDGTIDVLYKSISGEAGLQRDEALFQSIFLPDAQLCALQEDSMGQKHIRYMTPARFFKGMQAYTDQHGFFEIEIARKTEQFDHIAHVWSTYESRHAAMDQMPFARGINSIQLFFDGERWWVTNIYWQDESDEIPLPSVYLPKKGRKKQN